MGFPPFTSVPQSGVITWIGYSVLSLTADTYLDSLTNDDHSNSNIYSNGQYKLYVGGKEVRIHSGTYDSSSVSSNTTDTTVDSNNQNHNILYYVIGGIAFFVIVIAILVIVVKKNKNTLQMNSDNLNNW